MPSRGLSTAVKALFAALRLPRTIVLVEFHTLGLRITNWPRNVTIDGTTWNGAATGTPGRFTLKFEGVGENLTFEPPTAVLEIGSLDGWAQAHFFNDRFREDTCTIRLAYADVSNAILDTGWSTTFKCDAEECDANRVAIRLGSLDAATGTELPRRTTQSTGCQWQFQVSDDVGGCPFRFDPEVHKASLATCDRTFDGPNGCKAHFPPVMDPRTGLVLQRPKPYGGFLGSVDHRIVRAGR